jgi:tetratricopeptide (TPR) repeat protein
MTQIIIDNKSYDLDTPSTLELNALVALFAEQRYPETVELARAMAARFPLHVFGWKTWGSALLQMGQSAEALTPLQKASELAPGDADALTNLGITLKNLGRLDEAEMSYRQALKIKPGFAEALYNLGNTLNDMGKFADAEESYRRALHFKPDFARAYSGLAFALTKLSRLDEAEACYRRAVEINPHYVEAHYNQGRTLQELGLPEEAASSYLRALKIKPDYADALNNLGSVLYSLGKIEESKACYLKALECKPDWALAYFNLHAVLLDHDDMQHSIRCLEKVVEMYPSNVDFRFFLGMMLDYCGDLKMARDHFELVEKGSNASRARLDAWRYIKHANPILPLITGNNIQTFKLGIDAAPQDGLIMEFGVRFGTSIRQIAALVDQDVHGFDSFEGLPEQWHLEPKGMYSTKGVMPKVPDNVTLHPGWFEDTLPKFLRNFAGPVRFMNIDCDIYSSTKTVLDLLAERIVPGTVIVFDEYIGNECWRQDEFKAFQDAVDRYGWHYEYLCFSFCTKQVAIRILQNG